ncbi:hypothetical protein [Cetobacterium sp.]|uniref:hypothetical protein n=1 Tax=Cetobacterium sp. TaxID=2071632 RepID=UPI002FC5B989
MNTDLVRAKVIDYIDDRSDRNRSIVIETIYNDFGAHGISHIKDVLKSGATIKGAKLNLEEELAIIFHDCGNKINRKMHHILSAEIFREVCDNLLDNLTIERVANAIQKHRASYNGDFDNDLEELLSSSDRGNPDDIKNIVVRSYKYGLEELKLSESASVNHALEHIKNKYSREGYAKYPDMYLKFYSDQMNTFYKAVDDLKLKDILEIIHNRQNL